jgi:type VI secretion system protein ImpL
MGILRRLRALLTSRSLWTFIGLVLLALLIWIYGPQVAVGEVRPLADEVVRLAVIAAIFFAWLIWLVVAQRRAIRANRLFVADIAPEPAPRAPGEAALESVRAKFQDVLGELKRRKLGRRFLREMPWYVIIGPPATGKTTALKQSGLSFPIDLADDLQGVGGTRNCDWFFTEDAVLIDTAGRYTQQESDPQSDAAEWLGFLDLLKKHRGSRALNGVIVALSVDTLSEGDAALRAHGRAIRKRLTELMDRLEIRLPVYLMLTKADLIKGFEPFFAELGTAEREQVWGASFPPAGSTDGSEAARELAILVAQLERRWNNRLEGEDVLATRAEIFRFPAQVSSLAEPLRTVIDTIFGQSRYEPAAWLRGIYLTSATQEGTPIDRLTAALASSFGLPAQPEPPPRRTERRSFFLHDLLTKVVFREAGLGVLDPAAEERRAWIWRGGAVAAAAIFVLATLAFTFAYLANRGAVVAQVREFERLQGSVAEIASRQPATAPLDLDRALEAMTEIDRATAAPPAGAARLTGPTAAPEIERAHRVAYERGLRNILEPRMVALLEATIWRQIRDPEFLLDALKTYQMMTGLVAMDPDFAKTFWAGPLRERTPIEPFPTEAAALHQFAALDRMAVEETYVAADENLVRQALTAICAIPLPVRAYNALISQSVATALDDWVPAAHAGPNGARVLTRISGRTLRQGLPGVYTYDGFHSVIRPSLEEVAAQAALDGSIFASGCPESAGASVETLAEDMLKLYFDDFIAQWDGFLRDVTLAPLTDQSRQVIEQLRGASENLRDLASADSALRRLLTAIVRETDLVRVEEEAADTAAAPAGASRLLRRLGTVGRLASEGARYIPVAGGTAAVDTTGTPVAQHFRPLRAAVEEVDGRPPALDEATAALASLSNAVQLALNSPNPEEAIRRQGGLAELTGALANQAAILPDPLDTWLAGIAGEFRGFAEEAVVSQLNGIWRADVLPFCQAATAGRYPFAPASTIDVNTADFQRLFGPGGLIDAFTNDHLAPFIETSTRPWRWRADLGLDDGALAAFEQARSIRNALFPGGAGPIMSFTLEPKDLSASASRVTLNVDGQVVTYLHSATRPQPMTWPGRDGTGVVTLAFLPVDGSPEIMVSETGAWAWLRLIRSGRLSPTDLPELFNLRLSTRGHFADFGLRAASVENPFDLQMFSRFTCPSQL